MPTKGAGEELLNIGRGEAIILAINRFCMMFFASAGIGVLFALMSALLLKYVGEFRAYSSFSSLKIKSMTHKCFFKLSR